jgi:hypothetical protein
VESNIVREEELDTRSATLENSLALQAIKAEENVDQADIAEHEILLLFDRITAVRVAV